LTDRAPQTPLVIDPVMVATSGDALLQPDAIACYENQLFPRASLITPNLDEAGRLLGGSIRTIARMRTAGKRLVEKYHVPILLKGGHLAGDDAVDLLFIGNKVIEFSAPFMRGISTHGTGCTYSAAITAGLAGGLDLEKSIRRAKKFVTATIAQHFSWSGKTASAVQALNHRPNEM
jgi:hydroxymethylpyrimidine/phosphomethylpyrimidine kinase